MSEQVTPQTSGLTHDKIFSKQPYKGDSIAQNMFSSATRKDKKVMVPQTHMTGVSIQKLWDTAFADSSTFLQRYHDRRKEIKLSVGKWDYSADRSNGSRFVSLETMVDIPKAGTMTVLNEAHRFAYTKMENDHVMLVYQISSQTPNVPAGGTFRTEAYCEISAASPTDDCSIAIWGNCKKMSLAFTAIQYLAVPRAIKEMTAGYKMMVSMMAEDLRVSVDADAAADTAEDDGDDGADSNDSMGGGGGDAAMPGSAFLGVLLIFALLVTLVLLWSMSSMRGAAREAAMLSRSMRDRESLMDHRGSSACTAGCAAGPSSEESALMLAARETQLQTLRYRWLEQRGTIEKLESSISWMRLLMYLQWALLAGVVVKVFVF